MLTTNYFYDLPDELQHKIHISAINDDIKIIGLAYQEKKRLFNMSLPRGRVDRGACGHNRVYVTYTPHVNSVRWFLRPYSRAREWMVPSMGMEALLKFIKSLDDFNRLKNLVNLKHMDQHSRVTNNPTTYLNSKHAALLSLDQAQPCISQGVERWQKITQFEPTYLTHYLNNNNIKVYKSWNDKKIWKAVMSF